MRILYMTFITFTLLGFSYGANAEEKKMNVELTAYIPGFGLEYQLDDSRTLGLNYSLPFQSVNVNVTNYSNGVLQGGYYNNIFIGYGEDKAGATGFLNLDRYLYTGGVVGYQWMLESGINFNADAGLMLLILDDAGATRVLPIPAFAVSVGYAFSFDE